MITTEDRYDDALDRQGKHPTCGSRSQDEIIHDFEMAQTEEAREMYRREYEYEFGDHRITQKAWSAYKEASCAYYKSLENNK